MRVRPWLCLVALSIPAVLASTARAATGELVPLDPSLPPLREREHMVRVLIRDGFAVTRVEQVFENGADRDLEARWSVSLPAGATVAGCSVWIDGQEVAGEVVERERAERAREAELAAGREAGLVTREERRFELRIAPVRARSDQRVRLEYYQPLELDHGIGRYVYPLAPGGHGARARELFQGSAAVRRARIEVELRTSLPVEDVATPGWEGARLEMLSGAGPGLRRAVLEPPRGAPLEQDFVLYWRHPTPTQADLQLLAWTPPEGDGYLQLTLDPGLELAPELGSRDWVILLDVSGSMQGEKLRAAQQAAIGLLRAIPPGDRCQVLAFDQRVAELSPLGPASADRVEAAVRALQRVQAGGGTDVYGALEAAVRAADPARTRGVVLLSDGVVTAGVAQQRAFVELLGRADVRVCALAIGNEADLALLERAARVTGGFLLPVSPQDLIEGRVLQARDKLARAALRDVTLELEGGGVWGLEPARVPVLHAGEPLVVCGRYGAPGPVALRLRATVGGQPLEWRGQLTLPETAAGAPELARLWALRRVDALEQAEREQEPDPARAREALALALSHQLVTARTAMVLLSPTGYQAQGIARENAARLGVERAAQDSPGHGQASPAWVAQTPPAPRVDGPGSYHRSRGWSFGGGGGGGAFGPLGALLAAALARGARRARTGTRSAA